MCTAHLRQLWIPLAWEDSMNEDMAPAVHPIDRTLAAISGFHPL
jgi:hypothetical protein